MEYIIGLVVIIGVAIFIRRKKSKPPVDSDTISQAAAKRWIDTMGDDDFKNLLR